MYAIGLREPFALKTQTQLSPISIVVTAKCYFYVNIHSYTVFKLNI